MSDEVKAKLPLTQEQEAAVRHVRGPMLVRAGAGTGKTTVLTERIVRLIESGHAQPEQILAVTFTRDAAGEIAHRVGKRLGTEVEVRTGTFHSIAFRILKENAAGFDVIGKPDLYALLREELDAGRLPLKHFLEAADPGRFLRDLLEFLDRCQDELITPRSFEDFVDRVSKGAEDPPRMFRGSEADKLSCADRLARWQEISEVFKSVDRLLARYQVGTFGAIVSGAVRLLQERSDIREREQQRTRFLLIDEFQDANHAQIMLADLLTGSEKNVFAVGDPDQAIYRFRGATSAAFEDFKITFKPEKANVIKLTGNQRSLEPILAVAHAAIQPNPEPADAEYRRSPLTSERLKRQKGEESIAQPVAAVLHRSVEDEARDVLHRMEEMRAKETELRWRDFAVLFRSRAHARTLQELLERRGIPYRVKGTDLFDTGSVRDVMALLYVLDSADEHVEFFRLALQDRWGVDLEDLRQRLLRGGKEASVAGVLQSTGPGKRLMSAIDGLRQKTLSAGANVTLILKAAIEFLDLDTNAPDLKALMSLAQAWIEAPYFARKRLPDFLRYLEYYRESGEKLEAERACDRLGPKDPDSGETPDAVQLMTAHGAKGLEFMHVFVLRVASISFPMSYRPPVFEMPASLRHGAAALTADGETVHHEEERRLFYVAITRARDALLLYGKMHPKNDRPPSLYLRELVPEKGESRSIRERRLAGDRVDLEAEAGGLPPWLEAAREQGIGDAPLSAKAVEMYTTCPQQFLLSRAWNLPDEPGPAVHFGNVIHELLRDYYRRRAEDVAMTLDEMREAFRSRLRAKPIQNDFQRELFEKEGLGQIELFYRAASVPPYPDVITTEKDFNETIGGVPIRGRIDRMDRASDGSVSVVDYKTGRPKSEEYAKESLQLGIYGMVAEALGHRTGALVIHNTKDGSLAMADLSPKRKEKTLRAIKKVKEGIEDRRFAPKTGRHCQWCGYRDICPAVEVKLSSVAIEDQ
ncbi:MAG: ATP-dependent helicase [Acidobacteriales bacterium]|nr:ATP-dependent helicase [Terriglobales bacterium]